MQLPGLGWPVEGALVTCGMQSEANNFVKHGHRLFPRMLIFCESASANNIRLTHSQMFLTSFYLCLTLLVAHDVGSSSPVVDEHVSALQDGGLIARPP